VTLPRLGQEAVSPMIARRLSESPAST